MTANRQHLQDFLEEQYYNIVHQRWMSLSEVEYLKMQARDQQFIVRETPRTNVQIWQDFYRTVVSQ